MKLQSKGRILLSMEPLTVSNRVELQGTKNGMYFYSCNPNVATEEFHAGKHIIPYLDCFYIELPVEYESQNQLWQKFYETFGNRYEKLIDVDNNLSNIETMLKLINEEMPFQRNQRILDFGCGSGLSSMVWSRAPIWGYEPVKNMRQQAEGKDFKVLGKHEFLNLPENFFGSGFANYVFHLSVHESDMAVMLGKMADRAVFVTNFYKNINEKRVTGWFQKAGFVYKTIPTKGRGFDKYYVYIRK